MGGNDNRKVSSAPPFRAETPAPLCSPTTTLSSWEAADEGRLVVQRCRSWRTGWRHPPRGGHVPDCLSLEFEVVAAVRAVGRSTATASFITPSHPAFDYRFIAALVDLEEGIRLVPTCPGVEAADIQDRNGARGGIRRNRERRPVPFFPADRRGQLGAAS